MTTTTSSFRHQVNLHSHRCFPTESLCIIQILFDTRKFSLPRPQPSNPHSIGPITSSISSSLEGQLCIRLPLTIILVVLEFTMAKSHRQMTSCQTRSIMMVCTQDSWNNSLLTHRKTKESPTALERENALLIPPRTARARNQPRDPEDPLLGPRFKPPINWISRIQKMKNDPSSWNVTALQLQNADKKRRNGQTTLKQGLANCRTIRTNLR